MRFLERRAGEEGGSIVRFLERKRDTARAGTERALFPLLLLLAFLLSPRPVASAVPSYPPNVVYFVSVPLPGHFSPLVLQAAEMRRRGWDAIAVSSPSVRRLATSKGVPFWPAGEGVAECERAEAAFGAVAKAASRGSDFAVSAIDLLAWTVTMWECLYDTVEALIDGAGGARGVALVVADVVTTAAFDAAEQHGVPWTANNADLLYMLSSPVVLPPADGVPPPMSGLSQRQMGTALVQRAVHPLARLAIRAYLRLGLCAELNARRATRGLAPASMYRRLAGHLVVGTSSFGLESPRALPPNVVLVGPMVDRAEVAAGAGDDALEAWLAESDEPAVFVSMGTLATLDAAQIAALRGAFSGGDGAGFRVVWKVKEGADEARRGLDPARVRVVPRVPSQVGLLSHERVRAFLSHCGVCSAHEAALLGVPLVCVPMFADQLDMAHRVRDAGLGRVLRKERLTAAGVREALEAVLAGAGPEAADARRVASLLKAAGGVERAADLLEHVIEHGVEGLVPPEAHYPFLADLGADVLAVWAAAALVLWWAGRCCCRRCCCGCCWRRRRAQGGAGAAPGGGKEKGE